MAVDPSTQPPPWRAFQGMSPTGLTANQGAEEAWLTQQWWPFWSSLSADEREDYLRHWQATPEWRAALQFYSAETEGYDEAADALESEQYLAKHRASLIQKGWLARLRFWRR